MGNTLKLCSHKRPEDKNKWPRSVGAARAEPKIIDMSHASESKWSWKETECSGQYSYSKEPEMEDFNGTIEDALAQCKASPEDYEGALYQSGMKDWPEDQQKCQLVKRTGSGYTVTEEADGGFTYCENMYEALTQAEDVEVEEDEYTTGVLASFQSNAMGDPKMPGRGQGVADIPGLKIIGDIDPDDVKQGGVGDCWMLSAISALAEFDGAINKLFKNNSVRVSSCPQNDFNTYTVTLWDLSTWEEVDVVVDERLICKQDGSLLGAQPSIDGELWVPILEKALAAHCGGWDAIDGGNCTHAWRLLTGCRDQYTIKLSDDGETFACYGAKNANTGEWEELTNSPHDGFQGLWPMAWPEVGGGGDNSVTLSADDLFDRMHQWDDTNYVMGAGTQSGSDSHDHGGIVDGHAYTILTVMKDVAGSGINLIKVRNPWGSGEMESGDWDDDGPGWDEHPEVHDAINPTAADDGSFWLSQDEFFQNYKSVYLCAQDMSEFIQA